MIIEELRKSLTLIMRYPVSFLSVIVIMSLIFIGIYETAESLNTGPTTNNVNQSISRFILWSTLIGGFSSISSNIANEAKSGTLEVIFQTERSYIYIYLVRAIISVAISISINFVVLYVLSSIYNETIDINTVFVVCISSTLISAVGLGFVFGGITLFFKEIGPLTNLTQFVLLPVMLGGVINQTSPLFFMIPGYAATQLLFHDINGSWESISEFSAMLTGSIVWLFIGLVCLQLSVSNAKVRGTISQY